jgi:hypothetical protein
MGGKLTNLPTDRLSSQSFIGNILKQLVSFHKELSHWFQSKMINQSKMMLASQNLLLPSDRKRMSRRHTITTGTFCGPSRWHEHMLRPKLTNLPTDRLSSQSFIGNILQQLFSFHKELSHWFQSKMINHSWGWDLFGLD